MCFYKFRKRLQKLENMPFNYYIEKGCFLTGHSENGINFEMSNTLFRVSFAVLCSRIGTQLTSKRPPPPGANSSHKQSIYRNYQF